MSHPGNAAVMNYSNGNSFNAADSAQREAPIWGILAPIRPHF